MIFSIALAWCASLSPSVSGYKLYYGPDHTRTYTQSIQTSALTATIDNLTAGRAYFFAVTAYDSNGLESDFSNELGYVIPTLQIMGPGIVRFKRPVDRINVDYILESTDALGSSWQTDAATTTVLETVDGLELIELRSTIPSPIKFYRVKLQVTPVGC